MTSRTPTFPREGLLTLDGIVVLLKRTILNPTLTLPLFLALQYTEQGRRLLSLAGPRGAKLLKHFKMALALGLIGRVNNFLSRKSANNWASAKFDGPNEIVVVTGGSSGIGASIVRELTAPGRNIKAIVVMDVQPLLYQAESNVHFFKVDLASAASIATACAAVRDRIGNPTVLINNAGMCRGKTILEATEQDIALTFAVNTTSHYHLAREFLPSMIAANHGHVVTVASIAAYIIAPQMVDYGASKAAAQAFHEGLGLELKFRYGAPKVRTTLVSQGYVRTPLFQGFKSDSWFFVPVLAPETVADAVVDHVVKAEAGHIVLPRMYNLFTSIRGWPVWRANRLRAQTHDLMNNWYGKQVMR